MMNAKQLRTAVLAVVTSYNPQDGNYIDPEALTDAVLDVIEPPPLDAPGNPALDAGFTAWRDSLPARHWAKYDLSACRLGYEAGRAALPPDGEAVAWVTADILAAMRRGERAVPGWKYSTDFCIPLYAHPSPGNADRLKAVKNLCRYRPRPGSEVSAHMVGDDNGPWVRFADVEALLSSPPVVDRDALGRRVREAWVKWALTQPNPKPSWLVPYDELSEPDKEADRQIGEALSPPQTDEGDKRVDLDYTIAGFPFHIDDGQHYKTITIRDARGIIGTIVV